MPSSSGLVRLGGVAAVAGGVLYAVVGLLAGPYLIEHLYYMDNVVGYGVLALSLPWGALAAIAALHLLQRHRYGLQGAVATFATFVAFAGLLLAAVPLTFGVALDRVFASPLFWPLFWCVFVGFIVSGGGLVVLGVLVVAGKVVGGVLPRWCGVALLAGSPLGYVAMMAAWVRASDVLLGVAWVLVGCALLQAAGRRPERSSVAR